MTRDTGFPDDVVELIWDRDRGCCARCGLGLLWERRGETWVIHHRAPRGRGGAGKKAAWVNRAANGVLLCTKCHGEVESDRIEAFTFGWLVSRIGLARPSEIPVHHVLYGRVLLDDEGEWELAA